MQCRLTDIGKNIANCPEIPLFLPVKYAQRALCANPPSGNMKCVRMQLFQSTL